MLNESYIYKKLKLPKKVKGCQEINVPKNVFYFCTLQILKKYIFRKYFYKL